VKVAVSVEVVTADPVSGMVVTKTFVFIHFPIVFVAVFGLPVIIVAAVVIIVAVVVIPVPIPVVMVYRCGWKSDRHTCLEYYPAVVAGRCKLGF